VTSGRRLIEAGGCPYMALERKEARENRTWRATVGKEKVEKKGGRDRVINATFGEEQKIRKKRSFGGGNCQGSTRETFAPVPA